MYLDSYNNCIYCNSRKLKKQVDQSIPENFYLDAIRNDLKLSRK